MSDTRRRSAAAVVVPVFNRLALLRPTVASLRTQTLVDAEFIMVDDRSNETVWTYLQSLPDADPRFTVIRKPDNIERGCQASRNIGLDACAAETVLFLDSDDLLAPTCLADRQAAFDADPAADIVVGRQIMFSDDSDSRHWVNLPREDLDDLGRFLQVGHPIDVPWVNGGVTIRTSSLRSAGVRWRPEFHWDDVAFHVECLVAGLRPVRMAFPGPPDAYYRQHTGEKYGNTLFTTDGIRSTATMLQWIHRTLRTADALDAGRQHMLAFSFFQTCLLRAVDQGEYSLARELTSDAAESELLSGDDALRLQTYRMGRLAFRHSRRLTWYWNRLMRPTLLAHYYSERASTYGTMALPA